MRERPGAARESAAPAAARLGLLLVAAAASVACAPREEVPTLQVPGVVVTAPARTAPAGPALGEAPAAPILPRADSTAGQVAPTQRGER